MPSITFDKFDVGLDRRKGDDPQDPREREDYK